MVEQIIKSVISYVIPGLLGFLIAKVANYKKKNDSLKEGLKTLLQSNISNAFFFYEPTKKMPDYMYKNAKNEFKAYKQLDGNDYIDDLMEKMKQWEITRTGIIQDKESKK